MDIVHFSRDARSYGVVIEQGVLGRAGSHLAPHARKARLVVVTDRPVAAAQLPRLEASLRRAGVAVEPVNLPPGEQTKSWRHLEELLAALLPLVIERCAHAVALGGGHIGDPAGSPASILKLACTDRKDGEQGRR